MGKKYLETKKTSLESSILGMWAEAAKKEEAELDEKKGQVAAFDKNGKLVGNYADMKTAKELKPEKDGHTYEIDEDAELDEATGKEIAAKMMKDKSMKAFASKVAKMKTVSRNDLDRMLPDYVDGGAITKLFEEDELDESDVYDKDRYLIKGNKAILDNPKRGEKDKPNHVWATSEKEALAKKEEVELDEGTKEEYQKFFNAAMKKFGIDSPADLKSDEEKKKFFDYVDKNYKGEKDEEFNAFMKEKLGESFEFGTSEYRDHALNVTPGETDPEWAKARDFKVASMKEALAKVWGLAEKKLDKTSKELYDEEDEELKPVEGSKTMTGGKVAKVDVKPKTRVR